MRHLPVYKITDSSLCLEAAAIDIDSLNGRPLFRNLYLKMGYDKVAVIGRNGVGKSTLLNVLAGNDTPKRGTVTICQHTMVVPQVVTTVPWKHRTMDLHNQHTDISRHDLAVEVKNAGLRAFDIFEKETDLSPGEVRKCNLLYAKLYRPNLLFLDEPSHDLDQDGINWLKDWISTWENGLVLVSHERSILRLFTQFFIVQESGCRHFSGSFDDLMENLEREDIEKQKRYIHGLNVLMEREQHHAKVCRRRRRKKNVGRLREEARMPTKAQLKGNKGYAQTSQGKAEKIRNNRISASRTLVKAARRSLSVDLPLKVFFQDLPTPTKEVIQLSKAAVSINGRSLFTDINLKIRRNRIALTGPNGSGKTTLLNTMLLAHPLSSGTVTADLSKIGIIDQGATNWISNDSLLSRLTDSMNSVSPGALMELIIAHKFPLALAERPMASLSPGERTRAALMCLFQRSPAVEVILLDEPTFALDFIGISALTSALKSWPGGLVIVSHDRELLTAIGIEKEIKLGTA
jgi:ATPase subunit of ABC transporter with duplicated ATPase domains